MLSDVIIAGTVEASFLAVGILLNWWMFGRGEG